MSQLEKPIEAAKNGCWELIARLEAALDAGEIDEDAWHREMAAVITPLYLSKTTPWGQSGKGGDYSTWEQARSLIADAIHKDGTFLDVGCASGFLMECMEVWARHRGFTIEPYGLDISPELAGLARCRLPHWANRIYTGNAINWHPPRRFDFVHTGLEYVPHRRRRDLIEHLLRSVVAPAGRLIIGTTNEEIDETRTEPSQEQEVADWGFVITGRSERPHPTDHRIVRRVIWIDAPDHPPAP
jgi:SAM-dependent methyltransferase